MEDPEELYPELKKLVETGYSRMNKESLEYNEEFERLRMLARKWRNLVGEARFDIPPVLHRYVNWLMPDEWENCKRPSRIGFHDFKIEVPSFATINVTYKYCAGEWNFYQFEILESAQPVSSKCYHDLPLFLSLAKELKRPQKQKVVVEEIEGGLADNVKLIKVVENKPKKSGYVLTELDFINNPDADDDEFHNFDIHRANDDGMRGG